MTKLSAQNVFANNIVPTLMQVGACFLRFLLPPRCIGCQKLVADEGGMCPQCWSDITFVEPPFCPKTGVPLSYDLGDDFISAEAIAHPSSYNRLRAVAVYEGTARHLLLSMKFNDRPELAKPLGVQMVRVGGTLLDDADVIVPVPLHARRLFVRRFNQAAEMVKIIGEMTEKPTCLDALIRRRATRQQARLDYRARRLNVEGAFRVPAERSLAVQGRSVLLVDDVVTTGATADACARALLRAGAAGVDVLSFAMVVDCEAADYISA